MKNLRSLNHTQLHDHLKSPSLDWGHLSAEDAGQYFDLLKHPHDYKITGQTQTLLWLWMRLCESIEGTTLLFQAKDNAYLQDRGLAADLLCQTLLAWRRYEVDDLTFQMLPENAQKHARLLENLIEQWLPRAEPKLFMRDFLSSLPQKPFATQALSLILEQAKPFDDLSRVGQNDIALAGFLTSLVVLHDPKNDYHTSWMDLARPTLAMSGTIWNALVQSPNPQWTQTIVSSFTSSELSAFLSRRPLEVLRANPEDKAEILTKLWDKMTPQQQQTHLMHPCFDGCKEANVLREKSYMLAHVGLDPHACLHTQDSNFPLHSNKRPKKL